MAGTQERLARVEAQLEQILLTGARTHAELREYVAQQREILALQSEKLGELERGQAETRTHLRWMKGIWAGAQAAVAGVVAWWK